MLHLVQSILEEAGYKVIGAGSADSAIKAFDRMPHRPDLLLTDVVMPGMSGPMLVDQLLAKQPEPEGSLYVRLRRPSGRAALRRRKGLSAPDAKPFTLNALRSAVEAEIEAIARRACGAEAAESSCPLRRDAGLFPAGCKVWDSAGLSRSTRAGSGCAAGSGMKTTAGCRFTPSALPSSSISWPACSIAGPAWPRSGELKSGKLPCNN